jgi:hypothetical protein
MPIIDVLILAVARQPGGLTVAGMTTERDPKTGLRWVRLTADEPFQLEALRYADGALIRPGDVVRLELGEAAPMPPQVENVVAHLDGTPLQLARRLPDERRATFFAEHLDPAPREVLGGRQRSLCLVRPDDLTAIVERDPELDLFDAKFSVAIASGQINDDGTPKYLRSREDIVATDIYWRALMRGWLGDEEFMEWSAAELRERLGEVYLVIGLSPKGGIRVLGVHTVPEYAVAIDEENL